MNIEETKAARDILQAFIDGKCVECRIDESDNWCSVVTPSWDFVALQYRIKPEPKIIYVDEDLGHSNGYWVSSKDSVSAKLTEYVRLSDVKELK